MQRPWFRPLGPGEKQAAKVTVTVPITARPGDLAGTSISGYVTLERSGRR